METSFLKDSKADIMTKKNLIPNFDTFWSFNIWVSSKV